MIKNFVVPAICVGLFLCSGCAYEPAQDPTLPTQQVSSGPVLTTAQQQVQIIKNIQNSPNIPDSAKAQAIATVKGQSLNSANGGGASQSGQPTNADLEKMIEQIQSSTTIPASQKPQIIVQIKQHMQ